MYIGIVPVDLYEYWLGLVNTWLGGWLLTTDEDCTTDDHWQLAGCAPAAEVSHLTICFVELPCLKYYHNLVSYLAFCVT